MFFIKHVCKVFYELIYKINITSKLYTIFKMISFAKEKSQNHQNCCIKTFYMQQTSDFNTIYASLYLNYCILIHFFTYFMILCCELLDIATEIL